MRFIRAEVVTPPSFGRRTSLILEERLYWGEKAGDEEKIAPAVGDSKPVRSRAVREGRVA
jgi:hypothetical protein